MPYSIRRVEYYYTSVRDRPGAAYKLLAQMAEMGLNLVAFTAVPMGPMHTQLTIFPEDPALMSATAQRAGMKIDGPHPAFLVQGDDELGALAEIHQVLYQTNVNVFASTGVTDGSGTFGYLVYVRAEDFERASKALSL
jgi:predicted amino acid-binding ACT domain protein